MLDISSLHKHFAGVYALQDVSLSIKDGTVVALVGDNGAGKSTLAKCVSGVIVPDSGRVIFNGAEISGVGPAKARAAGIEMIYQDLSLCRKQDVVTNVFLGQEQTRGLFTKRKAMLSACNETFSELGIDIAPNSIVGSLSGGQQQSIAIARAMLAGPKLLIMDEPTAALAVKESQRVLEHIARVKACGVSVLIISHNLSDVLRASDRIIVMRQGAIKHDLAAEQTDVKDLTEKILGA